MFALTVDTDISSSDFLIFGRLGNREQCFSGSFTFFIFRCEPHASSSVFTVIFDATLSLSIFSVCDESMQLVSQNIVSRGDWLGKPANFKGPNNRVPAEVELTRHVTLTVHTTNKMADATNELFVFGDDFEHVRGG